MVFSSIIFIFLFLPIVIGILLIIRKEFRNFILLIASLIFYAWGEGEIVLLMLLSVLFNYSFGLWIEFTKVKKSAKKILVLSIIFNIGLLVFFKYSNFIADNINNVLLLFGFNTIEIEKIHLPIGISFFTFQAMSYVIDVYRKETPAQKNPINIALYISLFPQLIAGPIIRYHDVAKQIISRTINIDNFSSGVQKFIIGLGKKVIVANVAASVVDKIFAIPPDQIPPLSSWLGIILYTIQIYFDFSGYSDMAIGLGRMFGFDFLENFNYPYISQSIREFWRRWHISLSAWFRDYVYIPLGGNRISSTRTYLNLLIVFFITGLWHGASWNFIIWGLFHGVFLAIERFKFNKNIWKPIKHFYVLLIVITGWVLFRAENLTHALWYFKSMLGISSGNIKLYSAKMYFNNEIQYCLILGIIGSIPVFPFIKKIYRTKAKILANYKLLEFLISLVKFLFFIIVFIVSAMYLASGTYNPFIYFRF